MTAPTVIVPRHMTAPVRTLYCFCCNEWTEQKRERTWNGAVYKCTCGWETIHLISGGKKQEQ